MFELIITVSIICIVGLFVRKPKKVKENILEQCILEDTKKQGESKPKSIPHKKSVYLTSQTERNFYQILQDILTKDYVVHCQVSMMALVQPVNYKDNSKTWAKRMDFVITDRDTKILAVIELDDSSHRQKKRQDRDLYVNTAFDGHHKLLRFEAQGHYNPLEIASVIERETDIKCNISTPVPQYG
ncbi:DUF2726 domain-containing protein [Vibrio parahaemolyticus]|uniref:DUF2726 domain-containing protein n=1 Tax=Vibrio parahaemolyticus TaxID=670 RepID=UPI000471EBB7|nr:DUF2726 domain-containing protein [Vibrio parahaemolyticus]EIQ7472505.1 DUF2726 domain-containing protein [Vibrio parahaemolyticus]ELB2744090.1 DUF2726 domain-containing protein [Vibrio parahaemolyticus]MBE3683271.1 DUF2726 domain-containing protein [Vibrio parahaemolyticus]MBE4147937.1 DUF2726 domain-containing protein [Vibrio parahaemolyticus]MBE4196743.1 DUF2726 domain-containing protein [Vibrio parahaemolyticus]